MSAQNDLVNPREVIGGNHPPETISSIIAAENADKEIAAADKWGSLPAIADAEQSIKVQDAIDRLASLHKKYDAERAAEKKPHDDAAKAIQARWLPILHRVEVCLEPLQKLRKAWLNAEDLRLVRERQEKQKAAEKALREAEEAARRSAEQATQSPVSTKLYAEATAAKAKALAQAAAAVPERAQTKGSYGRPARSLVERWFGEVTDVVKAARHYRDRPELIEVLTKLVSADARGGLRDQPGRSAVPGCVIKSRKE